MAVDLVFLNSSQANQNSRFSSLNSVFRKARKAATPSVDVEGVERKRNRKRLKFKNYRRKKERWSECKRGPN